MNVIRRSVDAVVSLGALLAFSTAIFIVKTDAQPTSDALFAVLFSGALVTIFITHRNILYVRTEQLIPVTQLVLASFFVASVLGYIITSFNILTTARLRFTVLQVTPETLENTSMDLDAEWLLQNNVTLGLMSAFVPLLFVISILTTGYAFGKTVAVFQGADLTDFVFASIIAHGVLELFAAFNLAAMGVVYTVRAITIGNQVYNSTTERTVLQENIVVLYRMYLSDPVEFRQNCIYTAFLLSMLATAAVVEAHLSIFIPDVYLDVFY